MDPALNANQAADQTAYPYPAGVMPPEHEQTDTSGSTTTRGTNTETKALSPVQVEAEKGQDAASAEGEGVINEKTAQKRREAEIAADSARRAELAGQGFQSETDKAYADTQKMIDEGRARAAVAQQRLDNTPPASFFHHGDTWGDVLRGFGLALGAVGDAKVVGAAVRAGHAPPTLDTVGSIIASDMEKQKAHIAEMKDHVVMARTGIDDAFKARQQMLQDVSLREAAAYAQLERIGRARLAAVGLSQPDIDAHEAIAALHEKRAAAHAEYVKPLYETISKHVEEAKRKDEAVTSRTNAAAQAKANEGAAAAPPLAADFKTVAGFQPGMLEGVTPYALKDSEGQTAEGANARLKAAVIGDLVSKKAVANPEAADRLWQDQYEVRPSDSPEARATKLQRLHQTLDQITGGNVSRHLGSGAPAPAATAPPPAAPSARPAPRHVGPPAPPPDRAAQLRAGSDLLQRLRAAGDPRAAQVEARIRELVRGG